MSLKVIDHYITFNGKNLLTDYRLKIDGNKTFSTAVRDVERIGVPGRSGTLTIDNGRFDDVAVIYDCYIVSDFQRNIRALAAFLQQDSARHRLEDTIHPDSFRMGALSGAIDPDVIWLSAGRFELEFLCAPQRWLKSGEQTIEITHEADPVVIYNPTHFTAKPLIKVTAGTGAISFSNASISLTANNGATVIDCEIEDAWEGVTNRNPSIVRTTGSFPELLPGQNLVSVGEGMTIEVTPRWWTV